MSEDKPDYKTAFEDIFERKFIKLKKEMGSFIALIHYYKQEFNIEMPKEYKQFERKIIKII